MPDPRASRVSRERRAALYAFLFAATADQLVRGGFVEPSATMGTAKKKANRWLVRQPRRKRSGVRVVGLVQQRWTGRPSHLCARFFCRPKEAFHEYVKTELRLLFPHPFRPGSRTADTEPDGWVTIDGQDLAVEVDCGTMSRRQMQAKWRRYETEERDLLVVTVSEGRMQRLRAAAETVRDSFVQDAQTAAGGQALGGR